VWSERGPLRYERLTWPEVRRAAAEERVALVPVATLEDHGPHLPVDTDLRIVTEICERAATEAAGRVVLLPAIPHGYDPHHMDFPGAVTIGWDTFTRYCADVGRSLAHHGFRRMLFLNGHGSNQNLVEVAARLVMVERPEVLAAAAFYLASQQAAAVIERIRDSTRGGMAHACELETSIYLAIDPDAVAMDLAVDERGYPEGEHAWLDWSDGSLKLMPWWSAFSRSGVQGDATRATAAKGPGAAGRRGRRVRRLRGRAAGQAAPAAAPTGHWSLITRGVGSSRCTSRGVSRSTS
jgi:creatinine amidohydrolase